MTDLLFRAETTIELNSLEVTGLFEIVIISAITYRWRFLSKWSENDTADIRIVSESFFTEDDVIMNARAFGFDIKPTGEAA